MNWPRHLKPNLTHDTKVVKTVPKEKVTYWSWLGVGGPGERQEVEERRDIKKLLIQLRNDRKEEDEAEDLLKEMQINLEGDPGQIRCNRKLVPRVHADLERGPWVAKLHHGQNMADVSMQRHKYSQFDRRLLDLAQQAGWCRADKAQGILD